MIIILFFSNHIHSNKSLLSWIRQIHLVGKELVVVVDGYLGSMGRKRAQLGTAYFVFHA